MIGGNQFTILIGSAQIELKGMKLAIVADLPTNACPEVLAINLVPKSPRDIFMNVLVEQCDCTEPEFASAETGSSTDTDTSRI